MHSLDNETRPVKLATLCVVYNTLRVGHCYCPHEFNVTNMPDTWFLAPDFTFTTNGPLQLGMVISHWSKPSNVLADLSSPTTPKIALPKTTTLVEPSHGHKRSISSTNGVGIWSKFEGIASLGVDGSKGNSTIIDYGATDHEIRLFSSPLLPETASAIVNIPAVHAHINSGMFGRRAVYIVSGLRVAMTSFTVTTENGMERSFEIKASGPIGGPLPVEAGGKVSRAVATSAVNTYETAPGIIFAYRLHVIRIHRVNLETGLFHHKSAFMTGTDDLNHEALVVVEATEKEVGKDIEEEVTFDSEIFGEDGCCIFEVSK